MFRPLSLTLGVVFGVPLVLASAGACNAGGATSGSTSGGASNPITTSAGGVDQACVQSEYEARATPVSLYIMFDKSFSMQGTKWFQSTAGLQAFFSDPENAGLRVGLRFFPDTGCDQSCGIAACADPKVDAAELTELSAPTDTQEQLLLDAFIGVDPSGSTPLSAALDGALSWGQNVLANDPDQRAVVALVTDGLPEECETSDSHFVGAAQNALAQHDILTFTIGLEGANIDLLNAIAAAGGTEAAVVIGTANAQDELIAALNAIREVTIACSYDVPAMVDGDTVDPDRVNVIYETGGGQKITIGGVAGESACADSGGWYYDDPAMPSRIHLCPATCTSIREDADAKVTLQFGCATVPA